MDVSRPDGVRFGLWYDFRNPQHRERPFEEFYEATLDQITRAEERGFESVWLTEHHFCDDGYTPSPLVIAAAIAARTRNMRIGTNLITLPVHNPIRIAEDAATLAILSKGRFQLGLAVGYRQLEFEAFGRELAHRPSLMEEGLTIIRRALEGRPIGFHGKRHNIGDVRVMPLPKSSPLLLVGGMTKPAIERAARFADGFLSTGGVGHDLYLEALRDQGREASSGRIYAGNWAIIAPDPAAEAERLGQHILHQMNQYVSWGAFGPPDQIPAFQTVRSAVEQGFYRLWDADTAVRELLGIMEAYPQIVDIHFWAQFPGETVESGERRIEYIAEKVLPRLR